MKRLRRILVDGLTLVLFLLCVATAVLWVRSYWVANEWSFGRNVPAGPKGSRGFMAEFAPYRGSLEIHLYKLDIMDREAFWARQFLVSFPRRDRLFGYEFTFSRTRTSGLRDRDTFWERIGFGLEHNGFSFDESSDSWCVIRVPPWLLLLVTATMPAARIVAFKKRQQKIKQGHCISCGYDLRATPNRCPECGTEPTPMVLADPAPLERATDAGTISKPR